MENIFFLNPKNHATALPTVWMRFIGLASAIDSMNFKLFCLSKVWSLLYTLSHMLSISFEVWIIDSCCVDSKWGRTSCLKTCLVFKVWLSYRLIHWMDVSALLPVHQGLSIEDFQVTFSNHSRQRWFIFLQVVGNCGRGWIKKLRPSPTALKNLGTKSTYEKPGPDYYVGHRTML